MKKKIAVAALVAGLSVMASITAFAGEWKQDSIGWWWQNDDGTYPVNKWLWIDGNNDGFAEAYCFDKNGYMYENTTTPDGYKVDENGKLEGTKILIFGQTAETWQTIYSKGTSGPFSLQPNSVVNDEPSEIRFVDLTPYFNMDLDTLAAQLGSEEELSTIRSITELGFFSDASLDDRKGGTKLRFFIEQNSDASLKNGIEAINTNEEGLKDLIKGLTKENYTASELEDIVKKAGASNVTLDEKVNKESNWAINSNGQFIPTGTYTITYQDTLEFDYNGLQYTIRASGSSEKPIINYCRVERVS